MNTVSNKAKFRNEIGKELLKIYGALFKDEPIHGVVKESNSPSFYKIMNSRKVQTYVFIPIFSNPAFWSRLAYQDYTNQIKWIIEGIQSLHLLAENIGIRLKHDRILRSSILN
ncbi:hypothetical protein [Flavobacterium sp. W20_MBD1_R3]|uniref:hypothetical protein n=1 Tax=Flavobacterium sp. W20_MBD1_R3 TaxID=3240278 RepID=UPI003F913297